MSTVNQTREPEIFACGDTLKFKKYLREYLPSDGWAITYEIRGGASPTNDPFTVTSTADGDYHLVDIDGFCAAAIPGVYTLVGVVINATLGERHQIYYGELTLVPSLETEDQTATETHAQKMIRLLEAGLERLAAHEIDESNVERSQFIRAKRLDLERQLALNKEIRANEVKHERIRNGLDSGQFIRPALHIIS